LNSDVEKGQGFQNVQPVEIDYVAAAVLKKVR
jgi:hypothetical protein